MLEKLSSTIQVTEVERDGLPYYQLIHTPTGKRVEFDHDEKKVEAIREYMGRHSVPLYIRKDAQTFVFPKSKKTGEPVLALAALLFAVGKGVPISEVRKFRIQHAHGTFIEEGVENCHADNLASTGEPIHSNNSREFTVVAIGGQQFISLHLRAYGVTTFMDYSPELLDFLATPNNFSFGVSADGRIQAQTNQNGYNPYLAQVVYAFGEGRLNKDNFENIQEILNEMTEGRMLDVDHLNGDLANNCLLNLSLMLGTTNTAKKDMASLFYYPYDTYWAYDKRTGEYLIEFGLEPCPGAGFQTAYYKCADERALLNFLETMLGRLRLTDKLTGAIIAHDGQFVVLPTPKGMTEKCEGKAPRDTVADISHAMELLRMNEETPEVFRSWKIVKERPILHEFAAMLGRGAVVKITPLSPEEAKEYKRSKKPKRKLKRQQ